MVKWLVTVLLAMLLVGCSGKSDEETGDSGVTGPTSPDAVACAARAERGLEMVPGAGPDPTAPAIQELDSPYTILLSPDAGGWVRLTFPAAGTYAIHTGFAGVFRGLWAETGERALQPPRASDVCPTEVPEVFTITVSESVTYYMQLGPLTSIYFWVYVELVE